MKNGIIIQHALQKIEMRRTTAKHIADRNNEIAMTDSEYGRLSTEYSKLTFVLAEKGLASSPELASVEKRRKARLKELGISPKLLEPQIVCRICRDTGKVNGELCECVKREYYAELYDFLGISAPPTATFADADFDAMKNTSQSRFLKAIYSAYEKYCDKFPSVKLKNALFFGETGVGKTRLMSAIYNALTARGYETVFLTASELNNIFLRYHTEPVAARHALIADLLTCDALFIDDLGSEQKLKNVTDEYLLKVIGERDVNRKAYFISSNLNEIGLKENYNERLFSRLFNRNTTAVKEIIGDDLRLTMK